MTYNPQSITGERIRQISLELQEAQKFIDFTRRSMWELNGRLEIAKRCQLPDLILLSRSASGATRRRNLGEAVDMVLSAQQDKEAVQHLFKAEMDRRIDVIRLRIERKALSI